MNKKNKNMNLINQMCSNSLNNPNKINAAKYSPREAFLNILEIFKKSEMEGNKDNSESEINHAFESLEGVISKNTMKAIEQMNFKTMTEIQAKCIPKLLEGKDLRGTAKTGSGKTLAFLIPVVEHIAILKYQPMHGTGVIIVSPTRELALQIYGVLQKLMKYHSQTCGIVMGGTNINVESEKLLKGVNILVSTPGRLLDHLKNTPFKFSELICFVIDEADRICDSGFEKDLRSIIALLPKERQTMLFSATNDARTDNISSLALKNVLLEVDVAVDKAVSTTDGLTQKYIVCPIEKRTSLLRKFLLDRTKEKGMVFFNSCKVVSFYHDIFNKMNIPVSAIHGRLGQRCRTRTFNEFNKSTTGVLFCTNVAARGWDIPTIDWILQIEVPDDPKEYIHRVGRTARAGKEGKAFIFLSENETAFLPFLKNAKVNINKMEIEWSEVQDIQKQIMTAVSTDNAFKEVANKAYTAYIRSYHSHKLKKVLNFANMDLKMVARHFGMINPIKVSVQKGGGNMGGNKRKMKGKQRPNKMMKK